MYLFVILYTTANAHVTNLRSYPGRAITKFYMFSFCPEKQ